MTVDRLRELAPLLGAVEFHSHGTIGLASQTYLEAARLGFGTLHTAVAPLANGTSQPACEATLRNLAASGSPRARSRRVGGDVGALSGPWHWRRACHSGRPADYDAAYYHHQMPGGMITTMRRQLDELRRPELFDAALEEAGRVREEFGWPIMVTPFSQFVGSQAVMNVMASSATRASRTTSSSTSSAASGRRPRRPRRGSRIGCCPRRAPRSCGRVEPLTLDGARARFGSRISDEELLLRLTMPAEQVDAMRAALASTAAVESLAPVVRLLRELVDRPAIPPTFESSTRADDHRRSTAAMDLDDVRGFVFDVDGTLVQRFPDGVHPLPGAVEVLQRIRASGRPLALFTNANHVPPEVLAAQLRAAGLPVSDEEVVTPLRSALSHLRRRFPGARVLLLRCRSRRCGSGWFWKSRDRRGRRRARRRRARVPLQHGRLIAPERAARAVVAGARLLTANYLPAYAGANGPIFSRGAMLTAAIAKASGARPSVVGKPSRAAVRELQRPARRPDSRPAGHGGRPADGRGAGADGRVADSARAGRDQRLRRP